MRHAAHMRDAHAIGEPAESLTRWTNLDELDIVPADSRQGLEQPLRRPRSVEVSKVHDPQMLAVFRRGSVVQSVEPIRDAGHLFRMLRIAFAIEAFGAGGIQNQRVTAPHAQPFEESEHPPLRRGRSWRAG